MHTTQTQRIAAEDIAGFDPYALLAAIGKRVIHPGGRQSTEALLLFAEMRPEQRVLDVGCGVATTAIEVARRYGCQVSAVDISPLMLDRARRYVQQTKLAERVAIQKGDIQALAFAESSFDRVIAEAVTMFVDRPKAARELVRVCRPGGRVWRRNFSGAVRPRPRHARSSWVRSAQACGSTCMRTGSGCTRSLV